VDDLVLGYAALARTIRSKRIPKTITADPDDDKVLACAITASVDLIVSGDSHLLDLNEFEGIKIVTVNQLLERY
jgi:predicted nucleic acid-binding protein